MSALKEILEVWSRVFREWKYMILLIVVGFVFYLVNGLIVSLGNVSSIYGLLGFFGTLKFLISSAFYLAKGVSVYGAIGTIILSLLIGMMISLLFYRFDKVDKKSRESVGVLGSVGIFLGVAAPGCVACGIGVLTFIGLGSALAALPFGGHEIIFVAILLVGYSVVNISRKLYNPVCELKFDGKDERRY